MKVKILREAGYEEAMLGLSLSYNQDPGKMPKVAQKLKNKYGGHNKFLESIVVWIDIVAPRFFWSEFDTYRVGMTKQSESTIHTITRSELSNDNFEDGSIPQIYIDILNMGVRSKDLYGLKNLLPESFLQRRICSCNYMVLKNIINQRKDHKLPQWQYFINEVVDQLEHKELL